MITDVMYHTQLPYESDPLMSNSVNQTEYSVHWLYLEGSCCMIEIFMSVTVHAGYFPDQRMKGVFVLVIIRKLYKEKCLS